MLPMMLACSSSDDEPNSSLVGTVWECYEKWNDIEGSRIISFKTKTSCHVKVWEKVDGFDDYTSEAVGTYEYEDDLVIITWQDGYVESGVISGNKMTLTDEDGYTETFTKK